MSVSLAFEVLISEPTVYQALSHSLISHTYFFAILANSRKKTLVANTSIITNACVLKL